ncbi:hypothetical protein Dsin_025537 [Dipteronia sinensis]|uniref:Choline transporter-like protein n=1 Tax=Dipteronia sinensis TaxID=43782 RepID=A0AAD9ZW08_9ROSI|nr:hypothetical protein Dsin_025537 [Dipteronia sinensis]
MGSSDEDPNKPISFYDSSSPSQPLLSTKPAPIEEHTTTSHPDPSEPDPSQYLQISYNYGTRPLKDLPFLVLFLIFVLTTFGFGIFSICNRNSNYTNVSAFVYSASSSSCVNDSASLSLSLFDSWVLVGSGFSSSISDILRALIWTLVVVYVSLPFFVLVPVFINVYWFVACTLSSTCSDALPLVYRILVLVFVFLIIGVVVWIIVANWHRIELTVKIIGVASDALSKNLGLFLVLPLLTLGLVVYYSPIVVFLVFSRFNGKIVPKEESSGLYKCVWKQDSWVPAYFALAILTMLWSLTAMVEAQAYVISGTTAQWYFSKEDEKPKRSIRSSLRNALGPSSGTVCLSGLVICGVRVVRATVDSARQEDVPGCVNLILRCCVNTLLTAVEFLNKFTINFAAITGEAYCSSARMTYELLKRNLLSAVFVETVSTRLLAGIIFVVSALYTIAHLGIRHQASEMDKMCGPWPVRSYKAVTKLGVDSYFIAALAWVLLIVILSFFVHVLDNVIDTVYICFAIDRDRGEVYKAHVHEVYVHLPISRNHPPSYAPRTLSV